MIQFQNWKEVVFFDDVTLEQKRVSSDKMDLIVKVKETALVILLLVVDMVHMIN